jgi:enoyl-CoA hydratase/carnithine racemase
LAEKATEGRVHIEERHGWGVLTLDRPTTLNALSHDMVRAVSDALARWREDQSIQAVLIKAVPGKAFCAGGDIRVVVDAAREGGSAAAARFFADEYKMNWRIGTLGKPYVALIDGITMGGGLGISVHGTHRIATERTIIAMPETAIGFFPDVGGSYFLPRLPSRIGVYLGLTGARIDGATATRLGIATHFVPSTKMESFAAGLLDGAPLAEALNQHSEEPQPGGLDTPAIAAHFASDNVRAILASLAAAGSREDDSTSGERNDGFAARTLAVLRSRSPLSLRVVMAQLARGRQLDLAGCLAMEFRMVHHFLDASDFAEGVRAVVIDKDKQPRWRHDSIEAVSGREVEACFSPVPGDELILDWQH